MKAQNIFLLDLTDSFNISWLAWVMHIFAVAIRLKTYSKGMLNHEGGSQKMQMI